MTACTFTEISPPSREVSPNNLVDTLIRAGLQASAPSHWIAGVQFVPQSCGGGGIATGDECLNGCADKVANALEDVVKWKPYNIYAATQCSSFSDRQELSAAVAQTFAQSVPVIAATELYYGLSNAFEVDGLTCDNGDPFPLNPILATPTQLFPSGSDIADWETSTVLSVESAMVLALNTLADYGTGTVGTLHVSPGLGAFLLAEGFVSETNGIYRTVVGNHLVIAAPGYTGGSPLDVDGHSPGYLWPNVEWMYVTGPMGLLIDAPAFDQTFESRRNNHFVLAERYVLPYFDPACVQFGIPVNIADGVPPTIDFADPVSEGATRIVRINNDHYVSCVNEGSGEVGEVISPDVYLGVTTAT